MPAIDPKRIWSSTQLPTLPAVAVRLLDLTRDPEVGIVAVIQVIRTDPAISAKIIKAANSSFFGVRSEVTTIDRAVTLLGTTVCTSLALSFSLSDQGIARGPLVEHYRAYWKQSIVTAVAAQVLAEKYTPLQAGDLFLAGLLADIGRLAMLKTIPREYLTVLQAAAKSVQPLHELEAAQLGFDHAFIGGKLMENWQMPAMLGTAITHHEEDIRLEGEGPNSVSAMIRFAASVGAYFGSHASGAALTTMTRIGQDVFALDDAGVQEIVSAVEVKFACIADLFAMSADDLDDPTELMARANEQLAQLTLREHVAKTQASLRQEAAEREKEILEVQNHQLQQKALHDPLTGIYNRRFFEEALEREVTRCVRTAQMMALMFIDIDHFKKINDTYGHAFGDVALKAVARTLTTALRASDTVARYGGEEFVVMVSQPTESGVERLAERVLEAVANIVVSHEGQETRLTISLGAAYAVPGRTEMDLGTKLLAAADACLYESKAAGRARATFRSLVSPRDRRLFQLVNQQRFSRYLVGERLLDIPGVSKALLQCPPRRGRIGELSQRMGYLNALQVGQIAQEQEKTQHRFGEIALQKGLLTEQKLVHLLSTQQEDPRQVAAAIISLGLLDAPTTGAALERYLSLHSLSAPSGMGTGAKSLVAVS